MPGRNDPCPCGSGRKYKKCCLALEDLRSRARRAHQLDQRVATAVLGFGRERFGPDFIVGCGEAYGRREPAEEEYSIFVHWIGHHMEHEDGKTLARLYAETHPDLDEPARRWLAMQARTPVSAWEITEVEPGLALTLRDLWLGTRHRVIEETASRLLAPGQAVLGRVVEWDDCAVLCGLYPVPATPDQARSLQAELVERLGRTPTLGDLRSATVTRQLLDLWREMPKPVTRIYQFEPSHRAALVERLEQLEGAESEPGEEEVALRIVRKGGAVALVGIGSGTLVLQAGTRRWLETIAPEVEACGPDRLSLRDQSRVSSHEYKAQLYEAWLDEPLPALSGKTPREAAGDPRLESLLMDMEQRERSLPEDQRFDVGELRRRLEA